MHIIQLGLYLSIRIRSAGSVRYHRGLTGVRNADVVVVAVIGGRVKLELPSTCPVPRRRWAGRGRVGGHFGGGLGF